MRRKVKEQSQCFKVSMINTLFGGKKQRPRCRLYSCSEGRPDFLAQACLEAPVAELTVAS